MTTLKLTNEYLGSTELSLGGDNDPYYVLNTIYVSPLGSNVINASESIPEMEATRISVFPNSLAPSDPETEVQAQAVTLDVLGKIDDISDAIKSGQAVVNLRGTESLTAQFEEYRQRVIKSVSEEIDELTQKINEAEADSDSHKNLSNRKDGKEGTLSRVKNTPFPGQ